MAVIAGDFAFYRTTGNATGSDQASAQNDPNGSLGGWCSTTAMTTGANNLFDEWTSAQKSSSTLYRCFCVLHTNATDVFNAVRILAQDIDTYPTGVTIEIGWRFNDSTTVAPVCADESTAPTGVTFYSLTEWTGTASTDYPLAKPLGPLNTANDGSTDVNMDDDKRIFIYIKFTCASVTDSLDSLSFTTPLLGDAV